MWKLRQVVFFSVLFVFVGCSKDTRAPWPASVKFSGFGSAETLELTRSMQNLALKLGEQAFSFQEDPDLFHITITKVDAALQPNSPAGRATYTQSDCIVELSSLVFTKAYSPYLVPVLWHELGHCSGMSHDPNNGEMMYFLAKPLSAYTPEAIDRFMKLFEKLISVH